MVLPGITLVGGNQERNKIVQSWFTVHVWLLYWGVKSILRKPDVFIYGGGGGGDSKVVVTSKL